MTHSAVRPRTLLAALLGWSAVILQLFLTLRNSLVAGHGALHGLVIFFGFFTITTNILAALALTGHATASPGPFWALFRRPGVITTAAACMLIVGTLYFFLLRKLWHPDGLQFIVDVLLHYVMPPVMLVFWWLAVPRRSLEWFGLGGSLVYPIAYLVYVFVRGPIFGSYPYYFIDANALGLQRALLNAAAVALVYLVVVAVMTALNRGRSPLPA